MLDDDIVGADPTAGAPHRVRLFSGNGEMDDADSPSRELARAIEEIDGRAAIRMIFRVDRYGRGGDHYPFYKAGLPGCDSPSRSKTTITSIRHRARKTGSSTEILRSISTLRSWETWRGTMRRRCGNWHWLRLRRRTRSLRGRSRRTPK